MMIIICKIKQKFVNFPIRAFTLFETLLVLSVTSFLTLIFSSALTQTVHLVRGELFVLQFENDFKNTQEDAAFLEKSELLSFQNSVLKVEDETVKLPKEVQMTDFSIQFDAKGENSSLKKIRIFLPYAAKTVTYQLEMGSGKYKKTIS